MKMSTPSKGKPSREKALPAAGSQPEVSSMVGGLSNRTGANPSQRKSGPTMSFNKGGVARKSGRR